MLVIISDNMQSNLQAEGIMMTVYDLFLRNTVSAVIALPRYQSWSLHFHSQILYLVQLVVCSGNLN